MLRVNLVTFHKLEGKKWTFDSKFVAKFSLLTLNVDYNFSYKTKNTFKISF